MPKSKPSQSPQSYQNLLGLTLTRISGAQKVLAETCWAMCEKGIEEFKAGLAKHHAIIGDSPELAHTRFKNSAIFHAWAMARIQCDKPPVVKYIYHLLFAYLRKTNMPPEELDAFRAKAGAESDGYQKVFQGWIEGRGDNFTMAMEVLSRAVFDGAEIVPGMLTPDLLVFAGFYFDSYMTIAMAIRNPKILEDGDAGESTRMLAGETK